MVGGEWGELLAFWVKNNPGIVKKLAVLVIIITVAFAIVSLFPMGLF